jgi:hypothetical protein
MLPPRRVFGTTSAFYVGARLADRAESHTCPIHRNAVVFNKLSCDIIDAAVAGRPRQGWDNTPSYARHTLEANQQPQD